MKLLLLYPPFCSPVSPPYSLTNLAAAVRAHSSYDVVVLDLNLLYHAKRFPHYKALFQKGVMDIGKYFVESSQVYSLENKKVISGEDPNYLQEFVDLIVKAKADIVAFSVVYSSQVFYAFALLQALKEKGISCFLGGPAVNHTLLEVGTFLADERALLATLGVKVTDKKKVLDFRSYSDYFVPELVLPLKTVNTCYYQQCTFCTHHENLKYEEFSLEDIKQTLVVSKATKVFLMDNMNHKDRLLTLSEVFLECGVEWMCQLKPDAMWDVETLALLYRRGLRVVLWGVESGSQRMLDRMKKGTKVEDVERVLVHAHIVGIRNVVYMLFGFPGETEDSFLESVCFLERHEESISLVSPATFGLQEGAPLYKDPEVFGISSITRKERTILVPTVSYTLNSGLSQEEAEKMKKKYKSRINAVNKVPKWMNYFREHMLFLGLAAKDYSEGDYEKYVQPLTKRHIQELFLDNFGGWSDDVSRRKFFAVLDEGFVRLFFLQGVFVGYVAFGPERDESSFLLHNIHVVDAFQGKGYGKEMLDYVVSHSLGAPWLKLFVFKKNKALGFYLCYGFKQLDFLEKSQTCVLGLEI